ncbi:MAG: cation:proton antiporter [Pseudomonadota bacterium]
METLLLIAMVLMGYTMVAKRLERTIITAPMVFLAFGFLLHETGVMPAEQTEEALHIVAEVTLIVLLFLDAAQIDGKALLKRRAVWPTRMLLIGMPLAFAFGTLAAGLILPGMTLAMAALIAAILVPTDAALGQPVVTSPDVPERQRRALITESGLNDGLALPAILLLAAIVAPAAMAPEIGWPLFTLAQLTLGPLAGAIVGAVGGTVLLWAKRHHTTADVYEGIGALALAASAYLMAQMIGGNGFISAFAAGLAFGAVVKDQCKFVFEFTESEGQLLAWASFFLLGLVLVPEAVTHLTWPMALFILTCLAVVRPLAIWLSLIGTDADPPTRLFFGWFGPRGLATALFALLVAERVGHDLAEPIIHIAINAVWISALLHGITAVPFARLFARTTLRPEPLEVP